MSISFNAALDGHKLCLHPDRLDKFWSGQITYPITIEVSLTNRCNHNCTFCAMDYRRGTFDAHTETFVPMMREFVNHGVRGITIAGEGEPLLHKDFCDIVKQLSPIVSVGVMTNGSIGNPEIVDTLTRHTEWVRFSVNAFSPEAYEKVHGVNGKEATNVWELITRVSRAENKRCTVGVQTTLLQDNELEIPLIYEACEAAGVDYYTVKPVSVHPCQQPPIGAIDYYDGILGKIPDHCIRKKAFLNLDNGKPYKRCLAKPFFMFIAADGECYTCAQYVGTWHTFGNIYTDHIEKILRGKARVGEIHPSDCADCRTPCRLDAMNEFLEHCESVEHRNFV